MDVKTESPSLLSLEAGLATALTFDDVLLVPRHSDVLPNQVDVSTQLTRNIRLNVPIASAAMDTVTESSLAIAMAQHGGIGVIHKNLSIEEQASEVDRVKRSESGMIVNPITLSPTHRIYEALDLMKKFSISGVPITEDGSKEGRLVGILTNRDLRFETNISRPIADVMTRENLITVPVGTTLDAAREILHEHKVEKLLVVDRDYRLKGLITVKDIQKAVKYPNASKDSLGRLRCGAAIGVARDTMERADALVAANVDVLVIDTAHGHAQGVLDMVRQVRRRFSGVDVIAGNVATAEAHRGADRARRRCGEGRHRRRIDLHHAHHRRHRRADDHLRHGLRARRRAARYPGDCRRRHPLFGRRDEGDRGRREHGDDWQSLRGDRREPGRADSLSGPQLQGVPAAWGRSARCAAAAAIDISRTNSIWKRPAAPTSWCPRASKGAWPHKGSVAGLIYQLVGGLRAGMGYCGCKNIPTLQRDARLIRITAAGVRESHVHDVAITKEAPNYRSE